MYKKGNLYVKKKEYRWLTIEIKHVLLKCPGVDFGKNSSFLPNPADPDANLTLPPINHNQLVQNIDDYHESEHNIPEKTETI